MGTRLTGAEFDSIGDLLVSLGGISPKRLRFSPAPGSATVGDVVRLRDKTRRIYELVDDTLVEKVMGYGESVVASQVQRFLHRWNDANGEPGIVSGEAGTVKILGTLVRAPDVAFTDRDRLPNRAAPNKPVPELAPDLAVEVLSDGNTRAEMERKLKEYFLSEVQLVWYIDPRTRTVRVYTSPDAVTELGEADTLDGGDVLPGFSVAVARLFDQLAPAAKPAKAPKAAGKKPKKRK